MAANLQEQLPFIGDIQEIERSPNMDPQATDENKEVGTANEQIENDNNDSGDLV